MKAKQIATILLVGAVAAAFVIAVAVYGNIQTTQNHNATVTASQQATVENVASSHTPTMPMPASPTTTTTATTMPFTPTTPPIRIPTIQGTQLFFEDDFEAGILPRWTLDNAEAWSIIKDETDNHVLQGVGTDFAAARITGTLWDYSLEFKARIPDYQSGIPFIVEIRYQEECELYDLIFTPTNMDLLLEDYSLGNCYRTNLLGLDSRFDLRDNEWMSVKLDVINDKIIVYINEILLFEHVHDNAHTFGQIGFSVQDGNTVWLDDIRVTAFGE